MIRAIRNRLYGAGGLRKELARGAMGTFALKTIHGPLGLLVGIVLARILEPEGYGVYAFALSVAMLLGIPVQMGLPVLITRQVARYQYAERWELLRGLLQRANQAVLVMSVLIIIIAALGGRWFTADMTEVQRATLVWALVLLPLLALNNLRGAALRGLRRVVQGQLPEMFLQPIFLLVLVGITWLAWGDLTPPGAMALYCGAAALSFLIGAGLLWRELPPDVKTSTPSYETSAWVQSVLPLSFLAGFKIINNQTDIFMLGLFATKDEVGHYRVALALAALVIFVLTALNTVIAPHITRLHSAGDMRRLQRLVTYNARMVLLAAVPIAGTLMLAGSPILALLFGEPYREAAMVLAILALGQIINAGMGSAGLILNMTGHERDTLKAVAIAATTNVLLNWILIPRFGAEGAAAATAISIIIWHTFLCAAVWWRLGIQSTAVYLPMLDRTRGGNTPSGPEE